MKITIVQPEIIWEDKQANLNKIEQMICYHSGKTDIVVLPEMFTTGFTLNAGKFAEELNGETYRWMINISSRGNFAVCGSFIMRSDNKYYNHFSFITPQKEYFSYNKRHLFSQGGENEVYISGNERKVFNYYGFRFLPIICYDLRFPVWSRNRGDYDILICVASWPDVRREAWNILLKARAVENQCWVIGVNRVGTDNKNLRYAGDSVVIDPLGKILGNVNENVEGSATIEISLSELLDFREKFPVWKDSDDFSLNI
jgi:omega-amidase